MKIMKASRFYGVDERGYILTTKRWRIDAHLSDTVKFYFIAARREPEYDLGAYACLHFAWLRLRLTERD
jgi:hypothetical protein